MTAAERDRSADLLAVRVLALIRLAALPVIFVGEAIVPHHPAQEGLFVPLLVAAAVYALVAIGIAFSPYGPLVPGTAYASLDLAFICALTYTSGGPLSQLRYAFFFLPLGAALLLQPRYARSRPSPRRSPTCSSRSSTRRATGARPRSTSR